MITRYFKKNKNLELFAFLLELQKILFFKSQKNTPWFDIFWDVTSASLVLCVCIYKFEYNLRGKNQPCGNKAFLFLCVLFISHILSINKSKRLVTRRLATFGSVHKWYISQFSVKKTKKNTLSVPNRMVSDVGISCLQIMTKPAWLEVGENHFQLSGNQVGAGVSKNHPWRAHCL